MHDTDAIRGIKVQDLSQRYRRRRLSNGEKRHLMSRQNGRCFYCSVELHSIETHPDDFNRDPLWAVTDHKVPFCMGGLTDLDNCVISFRSCNAKKGKMTAEEFLGEF